MNTQSLRTDDCVGDVIERYAAMVYRLAFAEAKSRSDADDIFQEVFLRYINNSSAFESEEHRKAWLIRVTLNCAKKLRASSFYRRTTVLDESISYEIKEENDLHQALVQLPTKYSAVLHLFYYEDLSIEQISRTLGMKPSAVRTRLTRARRILKEKLKGEWFDV